mmetsp:Transcript_7900/g.31215  ORF Transcript_7900/g.31215 Transcript_7900/m.31215 type:complete len:273 (+) Transcript_7900:2152-2970(+)
MSPALPSPSAQSSRPASPCQTCSTCLTRTVASEPPARSSSMPSPLTPTSLQCSKRDRRTLPSEPRPAGLPGRRPSPLGGDQAAARPATPPVPPTGRILQQVLLLPPPQRRAARARMKARIRCTPTGSRPNPASSLAPCSRRALWFASGCSSGPLRPHRCCPGTQRRWRRLPLASPAGRPRPLSRQHPRARMTVQVRLRLQSGPRCRRRQSSNRSTLPGWKAAAWKSRSGEQASRCRRWTFQPTAPGRRSAPPWSAARSWCRRRCMPSCTLLP